MFKDNILMQISGSSQESSTGILAKVEARQTKAYRYFHNGLINNTLFVAKSHAPYTDEQMTSVFLNPNARVSVDKKTSDLTYAPGFAKTAAKVNKKEDTRQMVESLAKGAATAGNKVGVDVEDISAINMDNDTFLDRNFTEREQSYCRKAPSPQASFAGKWSAKEAVFKSLGVKSKGAGAPLREIEVLHDENGAPTVSVSLF
jgi:fatty acid synthase subunit alpha, fungi type